MGITNQAPDLLSGTLQLLILKSLDFDRLILTIHKVLNTA
jgi:hypothetical protein